MSPDGRPGPPPARRRRRRRREPREASELVRRYGTGAGRVGRSAGGAAGTTGALRPGWVAAVGEAAARHSDPVRRSRAGVVTVACSGAMWAQELMARHDQLLERLRAESGDATITGLRFVVSDHAVHDLTPRAPGPAARPAPAPTASDRTAGERAAQGIGDPELRALVARAAAASAARRRL